MSSDIFNRFSTNPVTLDINRSAFPLDHDIKLSADIGQVVPFFVYEVLPSDTISLDTAKVIRMQPMVTPVMDNLYCDTYYWYVPSRILYEHWNEFMGEPTQDAWTPSVEYTMPKIQIPSGGFDVGTIADYMGIPAKRGAGQKINHLPFRAYAMICNEFFRDQNVQTPVQVYKGDTTVIGVNTGDQVTDIIKGGQPFIANRYHDVFSSCLPAPQRASSVQVQFALNGLLPVLPYKYDHFTNNDTFPTENTYMDFIGVQNGNFTTISQSNLAIGGSKQAVASTSPTVSGFTSVLPNNLWADLQNTSIFDINELRTAFAVQRYYEKLARGGARLREQILSFFGTNVPDARVQVPEYLGGSRLNIQVNEVIQSSETNITPQGNTAGYSATGESNSDFTKSFQEHGWIIGTMVLRYKSTYQDGAERFWFQNTKFDIYNPTFANVGEFAVKSREIYLDAPENDTFGYQEAWYNYRYKPSRVCGLMRSNATASLDMWHFADAYSSQPYLSDSWMRIDKNNVDRALAVTSAVSNQYIADIYISGTAVRAMPLYSIPGLIDHH